MSLCSQCCLPKIFKDFSMIHFHNKYILLVLKFHHQVGIFLDIPDTLMCKVIHYL